MVEESPKKAKAKRASGERKVKTTARLAKDTDEINWFDISGEWDNPEESGYTFVDLFCGAGGLSKGLEMSGLEGVCGLDWFKEAGMTYRINFAHCFLSKATLRPKRRKMSFTLPSQKLYTAGNFQ